MKDELHRIWRARQELQRRMTLNGADLDRLADLLYQLDSAASVRWQAVTRGLGAPVGGWEERILREVRSS